MKPTERFSETVSYYAKYRPAYPQDVLQVLIEECQLTKETVIADVGSGTGILSKLFLDHGNTVYGIEPNQAMRLEAEQELKAYSSFHSLAGSAEQLPLDQHSVDLITVGTAFHWFDAVATKAEFKRVLRPPGWVLLVWNVRNLAQSPLLQDYENLILHYGSDYRESKARKFEKTAGASFFAPYEMKMKSFKNTQQLDWEGLKGRLLSTSYSLRPEDAGYDQMLEALKIIFDRYQKNGIVEFLYDTKLYYGHLL